MERVSFFIDGFNLYHALKDSRIQSRKWLDLDALAKALINKQTQQIHRIYYFSAYAFWISERVVRHKLYVSALKSVGVETVLGRFKAKPASCRTCNTHWTTHEEKETDLNIGLYMLDQAYKDTFDTAYLVTGDSDLVAAVRMIKNNFPTKRIVSVSPPGRRHSNELLQAADAHRAIKWSQIDRNVFPSAIRRRDGSYLNCPPKYMK